MSIATARSVRLHAVEFILDVRASLVFIDWFKSLSDSASICDTSAASPFCVACVLYCCLCVAQSAIEPELSHNSLRVVVHQYESIIYYSTK